MSQPFRRIRRALLAVLLLGAAITCYAALLVFPDPLFAYRPDCGPILLHSDEPIPASAAPVLPQEIERVAASPLYRRTAKRQVNLCNRPWRFVLFANVRHHASLNLNSRATASPWKSPIGKRLIRSNIPFPRS